MAEFTQPTFSFDALSLASPITSDDPSIHAKLVSTPRDQSYIFQLNWGGRVIFFSARRDYKKKPDKSYDVTWSLENCNTVSTIGQRAYDFSSASERDQAIQLELGVLSVFHDFLFGDAHGFTVNLLPPKNFCKN